MSVIVNQKILDALEQKGTISAEQRAELLQSMKKDQLIDEVLLEKNIIENEALLELKSQLMSVPIAHIKDYNIQADTLNLIPQDVSANHKMLAFESDGQILKVGMVNPYNIRAIEALDFLGRQTQMRTEVYLISLRDYEEGIKSYHTLGQEIASVLESTDQDLSQQQLDESEITEDTIKTAPVSKVVSVIIRHAVELGASDIHIEPEAGQTQVRYRIDGVLHTSLTLPLYMHDPVISRVKVLAKLKLDETRIPQDGRIKIKVAQREIDLRISTLPLLEHEKVSMRILDTAASIPTIDALGFTGSMKEKIQQVIKRPFGLVLVTGPTGSGKTTTLYTLINEINSPEVNITTLEDPIEYEIPGVNQSQIQPRIDYTFASGLRSLLRQDPDIIMVGEIRDVETAEMAIHAGLTGHLLFSTLHTNNAFGAIPRLLDMKVEPFLLSSTLNAIVAQRLVRTICSACKETQPAPPHIADEIKQSLQKIDASELPEGITLEGSLMMSHGKGCKECGGIGYKGRTGIGEILVVNDQVKNLMTNQQALLEDYVAAAEQQKMISMQQAGFLKVLTGQTTYEEVMRVTREDT